MGLQLLAYYRYRYGAWYGHGYRMGVDVNFLREVPYVFLVSVFSLNGFTATFHRCHNLGQNYNGIRTCVCVCCVLCCGDVLAVTLPAAPYRLL